MNRLKKMIWLFRFLVSELQLAVRQIKKRMIAMGSKPLSAIEYETRYNQKKLTPDNERQSFLIVREEPEIAKCERCGSNATTTTFAFDGTGGQKFYCRKCKTESDK